MSNPTPASVAEIQETLVSVFGELADLFGNPRSHGQVFGLLFTSREPLTQEAIAGRLGISSASISLALRALEAFGAVEKIPAPSARSQATYIAHTALRPLVLGFIQNRLAPKLAASQEKLAGAEALLKNINDPALGELATRVQRVSHWHRRASQVIAGADQILKLIAK